MAEKLIDHLRELDQRGMRVVPAEVSIQDVLALVDRCIHSATTSMVDGSTVVHLGGGTVNPKATAQLIRQQAFILADQVAGLKAKGQPDRAALLVDRLDRFIIETAKL